MQAIRGDQLRGHLESLVLAALEAGPAHGWDLCRRLDTTSGGLLTLREGSLYPALYRLEQQGLVAASWDETAQGRRGPRRRVYRLTARGRRRLETARGEWHTFVSVLGGILGASA